MVVVVWLEQSFLCPTQLVLSLGCDKNANHLLKRFSNWINLSNVIAKTIQGPKLWPYPYIRVLLSRNWCSGQTCRFSLDIPFTRFEPKLAWQWRILILNLKFKEWIDLQYMETLPCILLEFTSSLPIFSIYINTNICNVILL